MTNHHIQSSSFAHLVSALSFHSPHSSILYFFSLYSGLHHVSLHSNAPPQFWSYLSSQSFSVHSLSCSHYYIFIYIYEPCRSRCSKSCTYVCLTCFSPSSSQHFHLSFPYTRTGLMTVCLCNFWEGGRREGRNRMGA